MLHRQQSILILLCNFLILLGSCKKSNPSSAAAQDLYLSAVSYGPDSLQNFDAWLPAGRSADSTRVMILIHGGGWSSGDKSDFSSNLPNLESVFPGYAFFFLNYRLAKPSANKFPTQEMDVNSAVGYIYNNLSQYQISNRWVLFGASAGAHLALLQGYKHNELVKPKAIVSFFAPTDLVSLYNSPPSYSTPLILLYAIGGTPSQLPSIYSEASPVNYVSSTTCPTILLQGGADTLVAATQATELQTILQTNGVSNQLVYYPADGHGWSGTDLVDSYLKIQAFLDRYVQ